MIQPRPTRIHVEYEDGSLDTIEFLPDGATPLYALKRERPGIRSRGAGAYTPSGIADILSRTVRECQRIE